MSESGAEIENNKETTSSPLEFFEQLYRSKYYADRYEKYFSDKVLAPGVTEDEKIEVFNQQDEAKQALIDFTEEEMEFVFDPEKFDYPKDVEWEISNYIEFVKNFSIFVRNGRTNIDVENNQERIKSKDMKRSKYHRKAAKALFESGLAPSQRMAKALLSVVVKDPDARVPDYRKEKLRLLGAGVH